MPAIVRRPLVAIGLASALASTGVGTESGGLRQDPAPAAQQQQADPLKFSHDGALLLVWQIKPDRAEGFEQAWMTIRQALAKHQNADIRAFGESWSIHKVEAISPQSVIYIFHLNPVSKTYSYNPSPLLFETLKAPTPDPGAATPPANPPGTFSYDEAKAIFDKINGAWIEAGGIVPWPLRKLS
jgi:hypothetical protein